MQLSMAFLAFGMVSLLFGMLAQNVHSGNTLMFDQAVLRSINENVSDGFDSFFLIATEFGGVWVVTIVSIILLILFIKKQWYYRALLVAAGVGGVSLLNYCVKVTFERARPDLWTRLITETTYSFPSGHAAGSSALAICVVVLLWRTRWRTYALVIAPLYIVLIGFSRLYLGVHYLTDVIAGWMLSFLWLSVVVSLMYVIRAKKAKIKD